jgi:hypothetical protein
MRAEIPAASTYFSALGLAVVINSAIRTKQVVRLPGEQLCSGLHRVKGGRGAIVAEHIRFDFGKDVVTGE